MKEETIDTINSGCEHINVVEVTIIAEAEKSHSYLKINKDNFGEASL